MDFADDIHLNSLVIAATSYAGSNWDLCSYSIVLAIHAFVPITFDWLFDYLITSSVLLAVSRICHDRVLTGHA